VGPAETELPGVVFTIIAAVFYLVVRHQNLQRYRIRLEMIQRHRRHSSRPTQSAASL